MLVFSSSPALQFFEYRKGGSAGRHQSSWYCFHFSGHNNSSSLQLVGQAVVVVSVSVAAACRLGAIPLPAAVDGCGVPVQ